MEKFEEKIAEYRESDLKSSPIWVWFSRSNDQKMKRDLTFAIVPYSANLDQQLQW